MALPAASVPMKLPWTWLPEAERPRNWLITTPLPAFPEMTLRSLLEVPPTVLLLPFRITTPSLPLLATLLWSVGSSRRPFPSALVPIRLPRTRLLSALKLIPPGLKIWTPAWALPEITLPGPVPGEFVAPPIVLADEP